MSDDIDKLLGPNWGAGGLPYEFAEKQAHEINRLRKENMRLRAALGKIAADTKNCADHCVRQAQRALEGIVHNPPPADRDHRLR